MNIGISLYVDRVGVCTHNRSIKQENPKLCQKERERERVKENPKLVVYKY